MSEVGNGDGTLTSPELMGREPINQVLLPQQSIVFRIPRATGERLSTPRRSRGARGLVILDEAIRRFGCEDCGTHDLDEFLESI